jgi:hypothetical protein
MTFTFTPTPDDYAAVIRAMAWRHWATWAAAGGFGLAFLYGLWAAGQIPLGWLFLLPLPLMIAYQSLFVPLQWKQQARGRPKMLAETTWTVDEQQAVVANAFHETRTEWSGWRACAETGGYFILTLSTNKRLVQFIPKRAFASAEEMAAFRDLAARRIRRG